MLRALRCLALTIFAVSCLMAQRGGPPAGSTGNPGGNPTTATPTRPSQPTQPSPTNNPNQIPDVQIPIFLSGRVMMDDGTPPPTSIPIQRLCSTMPHTVAYTNARGQFNFQLGSPSGIVPDASESISAGGLRGLDDLGGNGPRGSQLGGGSGMGLSLVGCELIANAPGFRSDRIDLSGHRPNDNPEVGVIVLHRIAGVEGTSVSSTSMTAPKDAKKAWEKGVQYLHKAKAADAEKELTKAVGIYPKYANAWLDLGRARIQQQTFDSAREALLKALDADPKLVDPYVELGEMAARQQNWPDAAKYLDRALQLDPVDYPRLWFEDAVANYNLHEYDRAEKNAREALKLPAAQREPRANQLLGLILINKRDYTGAGEALRAYVKLSPNAKDIEQVKSQIDQIDSQLAAAKP
jgi:Tfp pilus assembly protein PilF